MTLRIWLALCCAVVMVVALAVQTTVAQLAPGNPFATGGFADASGGAGGSARGGDGGAGGAGFAPLCNQNTSDAMEDAFDTDAWAGDHEPRLVCPAGAQGGDAGKGGESEGGKGGIAFTVGFAPPPAPPPAIPNPFADVFIRNPIRLHSFDIDIGNNGPDPAHGVTLVATLEGDPPSSFAFATTTRGSCTGPAPDTSIVTPQTITCTIGDVAVGEIVTVTIEWNNLNECPGTATVMANASSTSPPDPDLTNNARSASQTKGVPC